MAATGLSSPPVEPSTDRPRDVLLYGTFDVDNYGDLLFPLVAEHRLQAAGLSCRPVAPTDTGPRWSDAARPIAVGAAFRQAPLGVLIGGGNIVHVNRSRLASYEAAGIDGIAYSSLWLGATLQAAGRDLNLAWNAPGVPAPFPPGPARRLTRAVVRAAGYVSVRDVSSRANLDTDTTVTVVPDPACDLPRVWPIGALRAEFRRVLEHAAAADASRRIAVHVKARSLDVDLADIGARLDQLSRDAEMQVMLIALGPCHGDVDVARAVSQAMSEPHLLLDRLGTLHELAAVITGADAYVGASLHGYITSAAYGRPGALVARPSLPKFKGFLEHIGRSDAFGGWAPALEAAPHLLPKPLPASIPTALDDHWASISQALAQHPAEGRRSRMALLRAYARECLSQPRWDHAFAMLDGTATMD